MMARTTDESEESAASDISMRPPLLSHQSSSLPSTPRPSARDGPFEARTPPRETHSKTHSPRSASGDSTQRMHAYNPAAQTCRFMFSQVSQRRMPYSDEAGGAPILPKPAREPKSTLDSSENTRLSKEVSDLYKQLLPSEDNQARRELLSRKLREIIAQAWPAKKFQVHVFGSSGNLLFTDRSDVDICITMSGLSTCALAELLNRRGMKDVKCVHAKIRIVKIWDPELQLNCDLNVNNELALTNTEMVKTYINLDPRVRPLAMIVKYWTRKRVINEASGGTLSSYTWTLLLINFLQTRSPPILPCLSLVDSDGDRRSDFSSDLKNHEDFSSSNKESLGELIFHFFRRYAYEIDFETVVVSVRAAALISKRDKGWHLATNNRLCVEEPFSVDRNLANTADDSAWRGLHLEFRRAFDFLAEAKSLAKDVCQQYDFLGPAKPTIDRAQPPSRPVVLTRSLSQSGRSTRGGGSMRGNRQFSGRDSTRNSGVSTRRASSAAAFGHAPVPMYANPQLGMPLDLFRSQHQSHLQQQPQQASGIHNHLAQVHSSLRAREQELRQQAANLAQVSAESERAASSTFFPSQPRPGTVGPINSRNPLNQPLSSGTLQSTTGYPYMRYDGSQWVVQYPGAQPVPNPNVGANISSPLMTPVPRRRELHRDQYSSSPGAVIRSQSQPARSAAQPSSTASNPHPRHSMMTMSPLGPQDNGIPYSFMQPVPPPPGWVGPFLTANGWALAPASTIQSGPREYLGYGIASPHLQPQYHDSPLARTATYDDLRHNARYTQPVDQHARIAASVSAVSRSPSPMRGINGPFDALRSAPLPTDSEQSDTGVGANLPPDGKFTPLIVNGSYTTPTQSSASSESIAMRPRRLSESDQYAQPILRSWTSSDDGIAQSQRFNSTTYAYQADHFSANQNEFLLDPHPQNERGEQNLNSNHDKISQEGHAGDKSRSDAHVEAGRALSPSVETISTSNSQVVPSESSSAWQDKTRPHLSQTSTIEIGSRTSQNLPRRSSGNRSSVSPLELAPNTSESNAESFQNPAKILSPVQETRTPSPGISLRHDSKNQIETDRFVNGESPTLNINGHYQSVSPQRSQHPLKQSSVHLEDSTTTSQEPSMTPSSSGKLKHLSAPLPMNDSGKAPSATPSSTSIPRGLAANSSATSNNPWQQAVGKKAAKKAKQVPNTQASSYTEASGGGQPMPANVSERKGG